MIGSDTELMQCLTAVRTGTSNSESAEVCWTPRGTNNPEGLNIIEERSAGGLTLSAVSSTRGHEYPFRFALDGCLVGLKKGKISTAQDSSIARRSPAGSHAQRDYTFTRRGVSIRSLPAAQVCQLAKRGYPGNCSIPPAARKTLSVQSRQGTGPRIRFAPSVSDVQSTWETP